MASSGDQCGNGEYGGLKPCETDSDTTSRQSGNESDGINKTRRNPQILKWAVVGLAVTSLLATAVYFHGFSGVNRIGKKHLVGLQVAGTPAANPAEVAIPCTEYPYVKVLSPPFWRNLGQAGPDYGDEGMFFNVTLSNMGGAVKEAQLRINAEPGYKPSWNEFNGINGEWVRINFNSGTVAGFRAYFWDKDTKAPMTLPAGYMTFSDIDGGPSAKEFVSISTASFTNNMFVGNASGLIMNNAMAPNPFIAQNVDATLYPITWLYNGTGVDLGKDNPDSCDTLTVNQKNNAVTFQIGSQGLSEVKFKLGATPGSTSRTIQFSFQPTLLCASTLMPDGTLKTPFDPAYRPRTQLGLVVNSTNLAQFNICTGSQCAPTAAPGATTPNSDDGTTTAR